MSKEIKIYIVDDETNIRTAIKTFMENAGFIVEDFENGDLLMNYLNMLINLFIK